MHWKTRKKLLTAINIYLTQLSDDLHHCYEIRIQLPTKEFVLITLEDPIPKKIEYKSLIPNGFNYDESIDPPIQIYVKNETLRILKNSRNYGDNDNKTVEFVIHLVEEMKSLKHS